MPQVELEQATIDYRVMGPEDSAHPPVLFVHGILVDHRLWARVAEGFARRGFRCILPDWPLGSHTIPVNSGADLSPRGIATLIRDFTVALGLSDVTLVGNDTGGGLCQFVVDAHPEVVGRLVLTNCDAFDKFPPFPFPVVFALLRGPASIKMSFGQMQLTALRHSPLGFGLLLSNPDPQLTKSSARTVPSGQSHLPRPGHPVAARRQDRSDRCVHAIPAVHQTRDAGVGQRDRCFKPSLGKRMAELFPNSSLIEVADAKTFVSLDNPGAVIDAIATIGAGKP